MQQHVAVGGRLHGDFDTTDAAVLNDRRLAEAAAEREAGLPSAQRSRQVARTTGQFLFSLAVSGKSNEILEIGGSRGYSTIWLAAGALLYGAVSLIDYRLWLSISHWFYFGCILTLLLVLTPGIGTERYGAQRWLDLGFFALQPSEPTKAAVLLIGANNFGQLRWSVADSLAGHDACVAEIRRRVAKLLVIGVLPSDRGDWTTQATRGMNAGLAQRYGGGKVAGVGWVDATSLFERGGTIDRSHYYDPLLRPPEPAIHPTAQAHARLAALIEPEIAAMLGDRPRT